MSDGPDIFLDDFEEINYPDDHKSGFVAIIGRPNAGKSTLLNAIIGEKLSVVTYKAQTTRHRITGIYSDEKTQIVFLDTPGMLSPEYKLHEAMMAAVDKARTDADIIIHLVDGRNVEKAVELVSYLANSKGKKILLAINKMDEASEENATEIEKKLSEEIDYHSVFKISALNKAGVDELINTIKNELPDGLPYYDKDILSNQPQRFFAEELIREQLFLQYDKEVPYSCAVNVVSYSEEEEIDHIHAEIVIERDSQKGIIIGNKGKAIKKLGIESRKSIETLVGKKVNLQLFVKVRKKWRQNETFLKSFGYR